MSQTDVSHAAPVATGTSRWTAGRVASIVIGAVMLFVSLALLGAGGTALWAHFTQRDAGYATTGVHRFSTAGSALETERIDLGTGGAGRLYPPSLLGKVRIRVIPTGSGRPLFVGIARPGDVDRYLAGVRHAVISDFWTGKVEPVAGGRVGSAPGTRRFWVAASSGPGPRTLVWKSESGSWTVVVMNADGTPGVGIGADLGARLPALPWIGLGLLVAGAVLATGGVLLIVSATRRRTD